MGHDIHRVDVHVHHIQDLLYFEFLEVITLAHADVVDHKADFAGYLSKLLNELISAIFSA